MLSADAQLRLDGTTSQLEISVEEHFNVVKLDIDNDQFSFLNYPKFFGDAYPSLLESWFFDFGIGRSSYRNCENSLNPPNLHRKEILLSPDHPSIPEFTALTESAESIGLFDDTSRIGFHRQWFVAVETQGYRVVGHQLVPIGNFEVDDSPSELKMSGPHERIVRQLTALSRQGLSAPVQSLDRHGCLGDRCTIFDYGCGRGDDVPHFAGSRHSTPT